MLENSDRREVRLRAAVAQILGTPAQRRRWRRSLGYSLRDVARITGMSHESVRLRESSKWRASRGSLLSQSGLAYLDLIASAQGIDWRAQLEHVDRTTAEGGSRAGPVAA